MGSVRLRCDELKFTTQNADDNKGLGVTTRNGFGHSRVVVMYPQPDYLANSRFGSIPTIKSGVLVNASLDIGETYSRIRI